VGLSGKDRKMIRWVVNSAGEIWLEDDEADEADDDA
jgi:hypothetical protein